jgi:hypothetical protein
MNPALPGLTKEKKDGMKHHIPYVVLFLLLSEIGLAFDSLPPLPNPLDIKLRITIPEEELNVTDTAEIALFGGFAWSPQKFNFGYPYGGQAIIPVRFQNKFLLFYGSYLADIDYEPFRYFSAYILLNVPYRQSFFSNSISLARKSRFATYFDNIAASNWSVVPTFFGEVNPKFTFRFSRFARYTHNYFHYLNLQNDFIIPTFVGNFDLAGSILTQSKIPFIGFASLADHIILYELNFFKPKVTWWFTDNDLSLGADFGTRIKKVIATLQFAWNDRQLMNFDTLYNDAGPFQVDEAIKYPVNLWSIKASVHFNRQEINLSLRADTNQINYVSPDSLFYPENSDKNSQFIGIGLQNTLGSFKNHLITEFNLGGLSLVPVFTISDNLTLSINDFAINLNPEIIGKRKFANQDLNPAFRLNSYFTYSHSFFKIRLGFANIFGSSLEVYPKYLDKNRKVFLEILTTKTL